MEDKINKFERTGCLDEIDIAHYVSLQCAKPERRRIESHLAECSLCRRELVLLTQAQNEIQNESQWDKLPATIHEEAMKFIRDKIDNQPIDNQQADILKIVLEWMKDHWEIVSHTGNLVLHHLFSVRGNSSHNKADLPSITKEMKQHLIKVDLSRAALDNKLDFKIGARKIKREKAVCKIRCVLRDGKNQKDLGDFTRDNTVSFDGLSSGEYLVEIERQGKIIGKIALHLL